jgi:hypothetical protein
VVVAQAEDIEFEFLKERLIDRFASRIIGEGVAIERLRAADAVLDRYIARIIRAPADLRLRRLLGVCAAREDDNERRAQMDSGAAGDSSRIHI